jgi:F0F1-type ATP synthase membrane subunit a
LFANMVAGHALIKILISFAWTMVFTGGLMTLFGLIGWIVILAITALEILISFLQAYVFVFLCMIYLHDAVI